MRLLILLLLFTAWLVAGCDSGSALPTPTATDTTNNTPTPTNPTDQTQSGNSNPVEPPQQEQPLGVSFSKDVMPILAANCNQAGCHGDVSPAKGIALTTYAAVRTLVRPGDSTNSKLYRQISGPRPKMPPGKPLSSADVATIQKWIDEGALNN